MTSTLDRREFLKSAAMATAMTAASGVPALAQTKDDHSGQRSVPDINGVTWDNVSDSVDVAAVGAVELSPSHPQQVWMGTGANDLARSSYSGTGLYKSMDGGETWELAGLGVGGGRRIRTLDRALRRRMLYPTELYPRNRERKWGGRRVLNPPPPESQSGALPDELRPPLRSTET